ncbi:hypothetical protein JXO52_13635 [bacterium]|nr:hypothetical protein [bacterium]
MNAVSSKKAIILSSNDSLRTRLIGMLEKVGIKYTILEEKEELILSIFNVDVHLVLIDIDPGDENRFKLLRILKTIRPRLNIIVILNDLNTDTCEDFIDAGAEYCLLNTECEVEVTAIAGSLESFEDIKTDL